MVRWILSSLPRGIYGRAALIVLAPIVIIQLVVSVVFVQRHIEGVTWQMTEGVALELRLLRDVRDAAPDAPLSDLIEIARQLELVLSPEATPPQADSVSMLDIQGRNVAHMFRMRLPDLVAVDTASHPDRVSIWLDWGPSIVKVEMDRERVSASNPNHLLVLMLATGVLLGLLAVFFLRRQLGPVAQLAHVAEAFGKGQTIPYRPRGAAEIRAAGTAFLEMRNRIERQRDQRTLLLSGVSHDLRTPLTRLKLGLAMLDPDESQPMVEDVAEMERMLNEFLAFARGSATERPEPVDPAALLESVVQRAGRSGIDISLATVDRPGPVVMRPDAIVRALENLIANAARHADRAEASLFASGRSLRFVIEDDGPGIPADRRDEAMRPFTRLDPARDPNEGGGVGLGLAIVADLARVHGGHLRLGDSDRLGGLKAELVISR